MRHHRARVRFLATPELLTFKCQPNFLNFQQARTFNRFLRLVFCDSFRGQRSDLAATRVERTSPRWQVLAYGFTVLKRTLLFRGGDDKDFSEGHKCARTLNSRTRKSVMCDQRRHARRLALKDIKREPHAHGGAEERPGGTVGGLWRPSYRVK